MLMKRNQLARASLAFAASVSGATFGLLAATPQKAAAQPSCEQDICNWQGAVCLGNPTARTGCNAIGPHTCEQYCCEGESCSS